MRCIIERELNTPGRKKYFYKIFKLYMLEKNSIGNLVELISIPSNVMDVLFIIGHNYQMRDYLRYNWKNIHENTIIIISCTSNLFREFCNKGKKIFVVTNKDELVYFYEGEQYGFDFQITDAELDLYNSRELDFRKKIKDIFEELV